MSFVHRSSLLSRFSAIHSLSTQKFEPAQNQFPIKPISEYFGELTFGLGQMRERLPREAYLDVVKALEQGKKLSHESAASIAQVIREWAVSKGATHFCHWFQPMTGSTAEKHDAFITIQHSYHTELKVVERFSGSQLIQGEPDASSFPSGGMRSTFEARGYTAWDPSCPIFITEGKLGNTLCIPTVFFGYHGQSLDLKTPLLRSMQALSNSGISFLKLLGDIDVKRVRSTLGCEQEYFLIDKQFASLRPDLVLSGKTVLGAPSPRGQQLEDHYFGSIPSRVRSFMEDMEIELYRLGIPVKTRHNEVAPSQFELAPMFEDAAIAADHNTLTMEVMKQVANRHGLFCLLHEKPFAQINGSGKHCNWSLSNDKGENLLDPGTTPHQNLRFLALLSVVLKAVHNHADALMSSIASPGNDFRLGGNEAPPAIFSVFLGSLLSKTLDDIESGKASEATQSQILSLDISHLPDISMDYTDRNRTSPFAFTGTKFEFRAVGASANVSVPVSFLNSAVAHALDTASYRLTELLEKKPTRDEAVMELVRELILETKNIRFDGNNYSKEWPEEAKKRGLSILTGTSNALPVLLDPKKTDFLRKTKVLSSDEILARFHVGVDRYNKTVQIDLCTLEDMVNVYVIPAIEKQLRISKKALDACSTEETKNLQKKRLEMLEHCYTEILNHLSALGKKLEQAESFEDEIQRMNFLANQGICQGKQLRLASDRAEHLVADELWPLPKYREMLFAIRLSS